MEEKLPMADFSDPRHQSQPRHIHQCQLLSRVLQACHQGPGSVQGCEAVDACLDGRPADQEAVPGLIPPLGGGVDHQVDAVPQDQVHHRGRFLGNLVHLPGLNPGLVQGRGRAPGGIDGIAQLREASS